jgi:carboxypeptidase C (cathepsin A)
MTLARMLLALALLLSFPLATRADAPASQPDKKEREKDKESDKEKDANKPGKDDKLTVTEHEIKLAKETLKYRATTGTMALKDEADKTKANLFFIAYEKLPKAENPATRPVTFVFNGGPGSASVWLHMGAVGPRRVLLNDNGDAPSPPFTSVDNDFTWLDATDLVFIDPVGTGFSRAAQGEDPKQFFGLEEDARSIADFIRLYTTRYERWGSPKFLAGESYGTTRAAKLSEVLQDAHGIALNGIVFISTVLNFQTIAFGAGNDLPYTTYLPTYTALAWYHKKLSPELMKDEPKALKEAEAFALGDYTSALAKGSALPADERAKVIKELSRLTSLPADLIDKSDLRIDPGFFRKKLLADSRQVIGRFDGRIAGFDSDPLDRETGFDPSLPAYLAAYTATFNDYVRRTLNFQSDADYAVLSGRVGPWNFGAGGWAGYPNVAGDLRSAMIKNPKLRLLFASGIYDLATPYLAKIYTVDHLDLGPDLSKNIEMKFYTGGHMLYHYKPALEQLHGDVSKFMAGAVAK